MAGSRCRSSSEESSISKRHRRSRKPRRFYEEVGERSTYQRKRPLSRSPSFDRRRLARPRDQRQRSPEATYTPRRSPDRTEEQQRSVVESIDTPTTSTASYELRIQTMEKRLEQLSQQSTQVDSRRFTIRSDCIPEFDPENEHLSALQWLAKIEQLKSINNWDDITTIYHMQGRLSGMARNWYHSLANYNHTWDQWKTLITKTFPDHVDFANVLKKMIKRTKLPNETMTTYYFEKMELMRTCEIQGRKAVSCLIDGLTNTTTQHGARAGRYQTPEALYEEYLSTFRDEKCSDIGTVNTEDRRKDHKVDLRQTLKNKSKHRQQQGSSSHSELRCFNCKQLGHVHAKCPKPRVQCQKCRMVGHESSTCRKTGQPFRKPLERPTGETEIILNLATNNNSNTCYFIDCVINNEPLRCYYRRYYRSIINSFGRQTRYISTVPYAIFRA